MLSARLRSIMPARTPRKLCATLVLLAIALMISGCGGGETKSAQSALEAAGTVELADFPKADGKMTLNELQKSVGALQNNNLLPAAGDFAQNAANRLPFGLFNQQRKAIWAPTVLYFARSSGAPAEGPFAAPAHSFDIPVKYRSSTTKADADSVGNGYYAGNLPPVKGSKLIGVLALTKTADGFEAAAIAMPLAKSFAAVAPGEAAPRIETPTGTTPAELDAIDTRDPHDDMHEVSLKDALDKRQPVVLVFATPKLCASRVCAPVTDVAEWVHHEYGDGVTFIHNEIYNDNDLNKGFRPQVRAFKLPSEPYTFVIDRQGHVDSVLQGPFDETELKAAVEKVR